MDAYPEPSSGLLQSSHPCYTKPLYFVWLAGGCTRCRLHEVLLQGISLLPLGKGRLQNSPVEPLSPLGRKKKVPPKRSAKKKQGIRRFQTHKTVTIHIHTPANFFINICVYCRISGRRNALGTGDKTHWHCRCSLFFFYFLLFPLLTPPTSAPRHSRIRQLRRRSDAAGNAKPLPTSSRGAASCFETNIFTSIVTVLHYTYPWAARHL
ncbi:hypothetical protein ACQKWADRAFT_292646 [Trichoderma austrokoningii]